MSKSMQLLATLGRKGGREAGRKGGREGKKLSVAAKSVGLLMVQMFLIW
jgi:hypothetical protein